MNNSKVSINALARKKILQDIESIKSSTGRITSYRFFPFGIRASLSKVLHYSENDAFNKSLYTRQVACNIRNMKNARNNPLCFEQVRAHMNEQVNTVFRKGEYENLCDNPGAYALLFTAEKADKNFIEHALSESDGMQEAGRIIFGTKVEEGVTIEGLLPDELNDKEANLFVTNIINKAAGELAQRKDSVSFDDVLDYLSEGYMAKYVEKLKESSQTGLSQSAFIDCCLSNCIFDASLSLIDLVAKLTLGFGFGLSLASVSSILLFGAALWFAYATLPITTALLRSTYQELAEIGDHGPITAFKNIYKACLDNWNKAIRNPNSFHPVIEGFIFASLLLILWVPITRYVAAGRHLFYYPLLDALLGAKRASQNGESYGAIGRAAGEHFVKGMFRGGILKDSLKWGINNLYHAAVHDFFISLLSDVGGFLFFHAEHNAISNTAKLFRTESPIVLNHAGDLSSSSSEEEEEESSSDSESD